MSSRLYGETGEKDVGRQWWAVDGDFFWTSDNIATADDIYVRRGRIRVMFLPRFICLSVSTVSQNVILRQFWVDGS